MTNLPDVSVSRSCDLSWYQREKSFDTRGVIAGSGRVFARTAQETSFAKGNRRSYVHAEHWPDSP